MTLDYLIHTIAPFCLIVAVLMIGVSVLTGFLMDWGRARGR